jgi:hypothetical protein
MLVGEIVEIQEGFQPMGIGLAQQAPESRTYSGPQLMPSHPSRDLTGVDAGWHTSPVHPGDERAHEPE